MQFYNFIYLCKERDLFLDVMWPIVHFLSHVLLFVGLMMARTYTETKITLDE
jgi:hypothetical protein